MFEAISALKAFKLLGVRSIDCNSCPSSQANAIPAKKNKEIKAGEAAGRLG